MSCSFFHIFPFVLCKAVFAMHKTNVAWGQENIKKVEKFVDFDAVFAKKYCFCGLFVVYLFYKLKEDCYGKDFGLH